MTWIDIITLAVAIIGAGLGIYNAVRYHIEKRPKLKVRLTYREKEECHPYYEKIQKSHCFDVSVVNMSQFPITVERIYLLMKDGIYIELQGTSTNTLKLGDRMDPRTRLDLSICQTFYTFFKDPPKGLYALTACGSKFYVPSKQFKNACREFIEASPTR